jgi:hypothetical protein
MDMIRFLSALAHFLLIFRRITGAMVVRQARGGQPADRRHTDGEIVIATAAKAIAGQASLVRGYPVVPAGIALERI